MLPDHLQHKLPYPLIVHRLPCMGYAHILDEDRKVNAQKFEATFYAKNPVNPLKDVKPPEETGTDLTNLIAALEQSPELVAMLTKALKG